ncbi:CDGSH iron-sulfur domain-containing protein 2 homolog [Euwallacea similis]|uniref:CDGSH iron-sulfur domain-containing protein 2 homolog n=1 Tax=Euwallacea similis TaxID=1736056 RepID=UPI00344BF7CE
MLGHLVKVTIPEYLSGLPIPDSFGGWFRLGFRDWLSLVPPTALAAGVGYTFYLAFCPKAQKAPIGRCNHAIQLTNPKVVDTIDVEDITDKAVFCRCWKSKNWPYCDGSHGNHNKETGDNLGPIIVKKVK